MGLSTSGLLALAASGGAMIFQAGCSVFDSIVAYVGVGLSAVVAVANLLAGSGVTSVGSGEAISAVVDLIKKAFADVQVAIAQYEGAPADQKATLKQKVATALQAVADEIQKFWSDLAIPDPKLGDLVHGLLGIVLSTLAGFAAQLPAPVSTPKAAVLKKRVVFSPKKRSVAKFRDDFNKLLEQGGYSSYKI